MITEQLTKYDLYYKDRMTKIESIGEKIREDIKEIKSYLKWFLGIFLGFSGIMLSLMAKGFHWIGG